MFNQIASKVLHESDKVRQQSIDQMREWIKKDHHIIRCRTDANFLLRFLRTSKFNVPNACQRLQRYLASRQIYSQWHQNLDIDDSVLAKCVLSGTLIPLPDRTSDGRKVIIHRCSSFDINSYVNTDGFRLMEICYEALLEEEETQVAGVVIVADLGGLSFKHLTWFGLLDFKNFLTSTIMGIPARVSQVVVVNCNIVQVKHNLKKKYTT